MPCPTSGWRGKAINEHGSLHLDFIQQTAASQLLLVAYDYFVNYLSPDESDYFAGKSKNEN